MLQRGELLAFNSTAYVATVRYADSSPRQSRTCRSPAPSRRRRWWRGGAWRSCGSMRRSRSMPWWSGCGDTEAPR